MFCRYERVPALACRCSGPVILVLGGGTSFGEVGGCAANFRPHPLFEFRLAVRSWVGNSPIHSRPGNSALRPLSWFELRGSFVGSRLDDFTNYDASGYVSPRQCVFPPRHVSLHASRQHERGSRASVQRSQSKQPCGGRKFRPRTLSPSESLQRNWKFFPPTRG